MEEKLIWKVTVYNEDRTILYFIAKSKLDASCKYREYVLKVYGDGKTGFISQYDDFEIEFHTIARE